MNDLIYYFGGWQNLTAPTYFSDDTWRFDPQATAGSRWTQIAAANLKPDEEEEIPVKTGPVNINTASLAELMSLPGVAEVASAGGYVKQYQVEIDPEKLYI